MVRKNDIIEVVIESAASEGEGVAKVDGYVIFVPYAAVGDKLLVKILKAGKSYAYAKIEEILSPSPLRVDSPCPAFLRCGGCDLLHLSYPTQLDFKHKKVEDAIRRIGGFQDAKIEAVKPMENIYNYRNKAQVPVGEKDGEIVAGFYAPRSHRIVESPNCVLQHRTNEIIVKTVLDWMNRYNIPPYNEQSHGGIVRHVYTRVGFASGEIMVSVVSASDSLPHKEELMHDLLNLDMDGFKIKSILHNVNPDKTNVVLGKATQVLYGRDHITDEIDGIEFKISHNSFYQVNPLMTEEIYKKTASLLEPLENKRIFDVYCGIGTISLYLARRAKSVIGIEWVPEAVEDASYNASRNNIDNAKFYAGDAGEVIKRLYREGTFADAVVLDPPRKGCNSELILTLCEMKPLEIVYVSCNPATLARDLKIFAERGYTFNTVYPFDQFPNTSHVETVVMMSRAK